jgi:hypothetical protein
MSKENFSPQESLQLIQSMIAKTRKNMGDKSIYFLIWGWITFIGFIGEFILKNLLQYEQHYLIWLLVIPAIIIQFVLLARDKKQHMVRTYVDDSMKYLWTGMGISFFVLSMILSRLGWSTNIFPFFILLYGLGTFISGMIIQFRPLIIGGIIAWVLAIMSVYFNYDYQMLFGAAAILASYIIPAYLLRHKNNISVN